MILYPGRSSFIPIRVCEPDEDHKRKLADVYKQNKVDNFFIELDIDAFPG